MQLPERIVEVRVGPAGGQGLVWRNPLHIDAEVTKTLGRHPNKATVKLFGLKDDSVAWLKQPNQVIYLLAGEGVPGQFFVGDIDTRQAKTKWEGPDRVTTIKAADGRRKFRASMFCQSYPPNTYRDAILPDIFVAMGVPTGTVDQLPAKLYAGGVAFAQRARDALTEVLGDDAWWTIQDGALDIYRADMAPSGNAVLLNSDSGLIGSPDTTDKGVDFKCNFNPAVLPGRGVRIESREWTGDLRITQAVPHVNTTGNPWEVKGVGVPI